MSRKGYLPRPRSLDGMRDLPLAAEHARFGARVGEDAGWRVPLHYGSQDEEHLAARRGLAVLDRSARARIHAAGEDAMPFLDGILTNDLKTLGRGQGLYAVSLDHKGRVHGAFTVFHERDHYVLEAEPDASGRALTYLQSLIVSEEVTLKDATADSAVFALLGPESPRVAKALLGSPPPADPYSFSAAREDPEWIVARLPDLGGDGFEVWAPAREGARLFDRLRRFGAAPIGLLAAEALRIEAGRPKYPMDMNEETLALEARLDDAISLTKGCYVGQEIVSRATYIGHVNRTLVGFEVEADRPPLSGAEVRAGSVVAGRVTSGARSAFLGKTIAMGYVRREWAGPGTPVNVAGAPARVAALPFVR